MSQLLDPGFAGIQYDGQFYPAIAVRFHPPQTVRLATNDDSVAKALGKTGYYVVERVNQPTLTIPFSAAALVKG